jgi:ribosomal protein L12E/L44/L45/RPP1/RPP2
MANQAEVGSARLRLSADTADFDKGVKQAESRLDRLAKRLGITAERAQMAGTAIGVAMLGVATAVGLGIKRAIDEADQLDELAQKIGIGVEQLSRLKFAAQLSGVPIEDLTTGVQKLSFAMEKVAAGEANSPAARALAAIGVSAKDAAGQLRPVDEVLVQIAQKFSGFADGAGKTALAMGIFGESGAKLIPFLNQGAGGIARLSAEADRLGVTLSGRAAASAGELNDNLEKISISSGALYRQIAERVVPSFVKLTEQLLDNGRKYGDVVTGAELAAKTLLGLGRVALAIDNVVRDLSISWAGFVETMGNVASLDFTAAGESYARTARLIEAESARATKVVNDFWAASQGPTGITADQVNRGGKGDLAPPDLPQAPMIDGPAAIKAKADAQALHNMELAKFNALRSEGLALEKELLTPGEQLAAQQERINMLLQRGAIDAETYGRAMAQASAFSAKNMDALASSVSSNLSAIFGESKAVAIASALINTFQGITKALATYPPPIAQAMAAIQAAAGFAQVANIRSQTGKGGGSGAGASAASVAPAAIPPQQQQSLFVSGISSDQLFTGDVVRGLVEKIADFAADGGKVMFAR